MREVLQKEDELNEIVQLVGKDALAETDKIVLETAKFLKEDFLQQNSFTAYDKYCPFYKSVEMLRNMVAFHELATRAIERTSQSDTKVTYAMIKARLGPLLYRVRGRLGWDPCHPSPTPARRPTTREHPSPAVCALDLRVHSSPVCDRCRRKSSRTPPRVRPRCVPSWASSTKT